MADSFRTDLSRAIDDAPDADRDAKIEQLLLAGLDHYFAARYEHAINVWTRALFFDRSHPRARAYIERARSALAERQRHSEELLHSGVAALDRGHGHEARRLLDAAIASGARADEIHPLLNRLNREGGATQAPAEERRSRPAGRLAAALKPRMPLPASVRGSRSRVWVGVLLPFGLAVVAVAGYTLAMREGIDLRMMFVSQAPPVTSAASSASRDTMLPLPRRGEMALGRARSLAVRGRLHEALSALDLVRATDPEKPEADRVRAEIQRQLLGLATTPPSPAPAPRDKGGGRQP